MGDTAGEYTMPKVIYNVKQGEDEILGEYLDSPLVNEEDKEIKDDLNTEIITLKSFSNDTIETVPIQFSDVSDNKVRFSDFYHDARSFLAKTNSTKFIIIAYLMLSIPLLLLYGYVSEDVYKEMVVVLAITYLGVDVYEKKSLIRGQEKLTEKDR